MEESTIMDESFDEGKLVLTPSALLTFLSQIEELDGRDDMSIEETSDTIELHIGDSSYILMSPETSEVAVDAEAAEEIQEINAEGYQTFNDEIAELSVDEDDAVEGGVIKELAKTLLVGGLVRLTKNVLTKS